MFDFKNYSLGISFKYLNILCGVIISFLLVPVMVSNLGKTRYGLWVTVSSIVGYIRLLKFGSTQTIKKYIAEYYPDQTKNANAIFSNAFFFYCLIGFFGVCGSFVIAHFIAKIIQVPMSLWEEAKVVVLLVGLNTSLSFFVGSIGSTLMGLKKYHILYIISSIVQIAHAVGIYVVLSFGFGLISLAALLILKTIVEGSLLLYYLKQKYESLKIKFDLINRKNLMAFLTPSLYYFLISIAIMIFFSTDNIIISVFVSVSAVTSYSIAFTMCNYGKELIWQFSSILFPYISEAHGKKDYRLIRKYHRILFKFTLICAVLLSLGLHFLGREFLLLWVGKSATVSSELLHIFIFITFTFIIIHPSSALINAMAKHKIPSMIQLTEAMLNVAFSLLLVHFIGVLGVALGTLLSHLVTNTWFLPWYALRVTYDSGLQFLRRAVYPVVAPACGGFIGGMLIDRLIVDKSALPLVLKISLLTAIFFALTWKFSLSDREKVFLKKKWRAVKKAM